MPKAQRGSPCSEQRFKIRTSKQGTNIIDSNIIPQCLLKRRRRWNLGWMWGKDCNSEGWGLVDPSSQAGLAFLVWDWCGTQEGAGQWSWSVMDLGEHRKPPTGVWLSGIEVGAGNDS